ncbi:MAG: (2Fe-2S)-binding protein [Sphingomonadales bacterium]|nr:(2Fe-2S)-binding protein [Sphingomonadales bacterium]
MVTFTLNGKSVEVDADPTMPLLWALRDVFNLTGTKFGCGVGMCGACTVTIEGAQTRSCQITLSDIEGLEIETIEGLSDNRDHVVQQAWILEQVPQCGYCQSGMIMAATSLLAENPTPTDDDIDEAMTNICRCGTYPRVRKAIHRAAGMMREGVI